MVDAALERLVNVVTLLAESERPLEREEIVRLVPGFPAGDAASAKAFERVKETARSLGIVIETVTLPGRSRVGYRIPADAGCIRLCEAELRALQNALGAVQVVGAEEGLARIGLLLGARPAIGRRSELLTAPRPLLAALRERRLVHFGYRGRRREVAPLAVAARWGRGYLVALDEGVAKTFRLDRIEEPLELGEVLAAVPSVDVVSVLPGHPRELGREAPISVVLAGPRERLAAVAANPNDGRLLVANQSILLADVVLHDLVVREPAPMVRRVGEHARRARQALLRTQRPPRAPRPRTPRRSLPERYELLGTMLAALRDRGTMRLGALAELVGISREEALELLETASLCGLPPYSPDVLLEVLIDDAAEEVEATLRSVPPLGWLSEVDAAAVAATLAALREAHAGCLPPELEGIWDRLSHRLGNALIAAQTPREAALLRTVHEAIETGARLRFSYAPLGSASGERLVAPRELHALDGVWYLDARSTDGRVRTFRLDRMSELVVERAGGPESGGSAEEPRPSRPLVRAVLGVPEDLRPLADYVLGVGAVEEDGSVQLEAYRLGWAARAVVALAAEVWAGPGELIEEAVRVADALAARHDGGLDGLAC